MRITLTMTTDGPRQAVFNTAELLENILLHMPAKSVIGAQRVCRQFRDVVATSVQLQRKLFLRPAVPAITERWGTTGHDRMRVSSSGDLPSGLTHNIFGRLYLKQPATVFNTILGKLPRNLPSFECFAASNMFADSENLFFDNSRAMLVGAGSWKNTYLIDAEPQVSGSVDLTDPRAATTDEAWGYTLGSLVDAACKDAVKLHGCYVGDRLCTHHGRAFDLIEQLEAKTGKKAVVEQLLVRMWDVSLPSRKKREAARDV
ncbi:hypothetical protein B0A55_06286 [Friedmanniomyces simplex]|uniref:F-box domain-containing protein n=1 Tax=Friedmanniomyces simplex TaxID=329884 RepID=A0A4U0XB51_9PEZI|nr:hypothetical protein B0A55_06286 [Friedmanniomyces simplex]